MRIMLTRRAHGDYVGTLDSHETMATPLHQNGANHPAHKEAHMVRNDNALTVGMLKALLDKMALSDDVVIATGCCSGADGHVMEAGTFTTTFGRPETFSLDPSVVQTEHGATLLFHADRDYVTIERKYDDDEDTEGE